MWSASEHGARKSHIHEMEGNSENGETNIESDKKEGRVWEAKFE